MAVSKKNRRKIVVTERTYYWYIKEDWDDCPSDVDYKNMNALNILSEDKKFIVRYHLGFQSDEKRHITIIGNEFNGVEDSGCWRRVCCKDWLAGGLAVTPKMVRAIIEWSLDDKSEVSEVDFGERRI